MALDDTVGMDLNSVSLELVSASALSVRTLVKISVHVDSPSRGSMIRANAAVRREALLAAAIRIPRGRDSS
jgi:hypothetical protein